MFFFFSTCILVRYVYCIRHDTTWKNICSTNTATKKIFKNSKTKNRPVHTLSSSPITTTFASYSRSFAILLACCERRRLRFNTLHPFPTIPLSSLREGRILSSAYVSFFRSGHRWCTEHTCSDIATWRCMFMTFGVDFTFFFWEGFASKRLCQIHLRCGTIFYFLSMISLFGFFFYRGGNGYHFQGSRGGNDTRLHCLGTVEYLGLFFIALLSSLIFYGLFLCTWNLGIGEQHFLATGMWLVGSGSETMGCGVVSVWTRYPWGSLAVCESRPLCT